MVEKNYCTPPASKEDIASSSSSSFYPSQKIQLLHQRTSLSLCYDKSAGWGYGGETSLYVIVDPQNSNSVGKPDESIRSGNNGGDHGKKKGKIELGLHLRDGCIVESVRVLGVARMDDTSVNTTVESGPAVENAPDGDAPMQEDVPPPIDHATTIKPLEHHTISYHHHDPLSIVLTRPADMHSVEDDGQKKTKQHDAETTARYYQADAHASRGIRGMTNSLRAASIGSCFGELRVGIVPKDATTKTDGGVEESDHRTRVTVQEAISSWRRDLNVASGESKRGNIESKMIDNMIEWRCKSRREARVEFISKLLGEASVVADDAGLAPAMKVVIRFSLRPASMPPSALVHNASGIDTAESARQSQPAVTIKHIGGLSFASPPPDIPLELLPTHHKTPHVYTNPGTFGDHQGVRSWLPTLDSASPYHRCSHELTVMVTAPQTEGLWPAASGEDFGCNKSVCHPILGGDEVDILNKMKEECVDDEICKSGIARVERVMGIAEGCIGAALGERHARFIHDFFHGPIVDGGDAGNEEKIQPDVPSSSAVPDSITSSDLGLTEATDVDLINQLRKLQPRYVTSIVSSLIWSPCPSRSLGFAVGPFATVYDPEYFRLDYDEEDNDEDEAEEEDHSPLCIAETARKQGEGIRQLYFAPLDDRPWIHADVTDDLVFKDFPFRARQHRKRPELSPAALQDHKLIEGAILASTIGVPNRALSLMRDVLALPAYRTSSYTQIWIPNAHMSGSTCGGNMVGCPEVGGCNYFLGGAIIDSCLLPPPGMRLPFYNEGRALQFIQARNAIRGWVRSALPLGNDDDVGQGYLHVLVETFLMSLYERGHGAFGEGGGKGSFFYTKRYAIGSGLNSPNLDFLPLQNIEEDDAVPGGVAIEERGNEHLWRSANNGTETHTSSLDEFTVGQLQAKDFTEAIERNDNVVKNPTCPLPSMGWLGSHQSATFFSNNSSASSALGCGSLELAHPMGGQMYRAVKNILFSKVCESRASVPHYTRVIRAAFTASFLRDFGVTEISLDERKESEIKDNDAALASRPPFLVCVEEMLKKQGLTHALFTRALRVMSGPIHETYLRGSLVDAARENRDTRNKRIVQPEGFPNAFVRGASGLYLRVGAHVEAADGSVQATTVSQSAAAVKGIHLHVVVEPVIPKYASAFGGPVTLRVIENEGQCREFVKTIPEDGSRAEWGPLFLHARPVTTAKQQQSAAGIAESAATASEGTAGTSGARTSAFSSDHLHKGGFQALELIRITNSTPLLWIRVDPQGLYNGRINIYLQDACLAEQLFHDGDPSGQIEAMRALAERPMKIQSQPKLTNVHDVPIRELPVRVLGDCLRGSVALHCDLPHNPLIRSNAALAIGQWQNNQAPESRDVVGGTSWLALDLLLQYFKERYFHNDVVLPVNFRRLVLHKHIAGGAGGDTTSDGGYQYIDSLREKEDRKNAIEFADEVEIEEDEEYRVRSSCITAIASIRAQDGMTPPAVLNFLQEVLVSGDKAAHGSLLLPKEEELLKKKQEQALNDELANIRRIIGPNDDDVSNLPYVSLSLVADALLALCNVHVRQSEFNVNEEHPIIPLMETCRSWLDWDLERLRIKIVKNKAHVTGFGEACQSNIAPCAITALCHMAILKQISSISSADEPQNIDSTVGSKRKIGQSKLDEPTRAQFYVDIFNAQPSLPDATRAAAAQAFVCICLAADRSEGTVKEPLGLLTSLEFLLDGILALSTSPGLRLTLALLMLDACTGRICSWKRVASFCGQQSLSSAGSRLINGPLGASCGGDNGSALLMTVSDFSYPAANGVNAGARLGLRLLKDPCKADDNKKYSNEAVIKVATFATRLWRTINGEQCNNFTANGDKTRASVCAHDSYLRCALVALWQCIWNKHCMQLLKAQGWHAMKGKPEYYAMGIDKILQQTLKEKDAVAREDAVLQPLAEIIDRELDRQQWRGEMAAKAYEYSEMDNKNNQAEIGRPLPLVEKNAAWKMGGWVASTAQQRREKNLDGGRAVKKINLHIQPKSSVEG